MASRTASGVGLRCAITAGSFAVLVASASSARADDAAISTATATLRAAPLEPLEGAWFSPTATYVHDDVPPRPVDAAEERECDEDDPDARLDPRCQDVRAETSTSMNSAPLVVVGSALTVVGALGIAGGVALAGYESGPSTTRTSLNCRADTSGVGCDPSLDASGAVDVLATVGGVGLVVVGGAVALTGVTLVVVGAVPKDDAPTRPTVQLSIAPSRVAVGGTF